MFWILLPFGIIAILVGAMLLAGSTVDKLLRISKEQPRRAEPGENCLTRALAMVDKDGAVRFLSRDEYESLKKLNPRLMELQACGIVYLTEVPEMSKLTTLASPKAHQ